jgi:hypothetical protein
VPLALVFLLLVELSGPKPLSLSSPELLDLEGFYDKVELPSLVFPIDDQLVLAAVEPAAIVELE